MLYTWDVKWREKARLEERMLRATLFSILGDRCSNPLCLVPGGCMDMRCLQIDHINGGGLAEAKRGRIAMYRRYVNDPVLAKKSLQILCANCNWIKRIENHEVKKLGSHHGRRFIPKSKWRDAGMTGQAAADSFDEMNNFLLNTLMK